MKLVYFAWLRERLGVDEETVELPDNVKTIADLFEWQKTRDIPFSDVFEHSDIIQVALDKKHAQNRDTEIETVSEIAMFPPMTGG